MSRQSYWREYTGPGSSAARQRDHERAGRRECRQDEIEAEDLDYIAEARPNIVEGLWDCYLAQVDDYQNLVDEGDDEGVPFVDGGVPGDVIAENAFDWGSPGRRRGRDIVDVALGELCEAGFVESTDDGCYRLTPQVVALFDGLDRLEIRRLAQCGGPMADAREAPAAAPDGASLSGPDAERPSEHGVWLGSDADPDDDIPF